MQQPPQVPTQVPLQNKTEVRERIVERPSPFDSALITALFECDSNNRVVLKAFDRLLSDNMNMQTEILQHDSLLKLSLRMKTNPPPTREIIRDSIVYQDVPVFVKGDTIEVPRQPTRLEKIFFFSGIIALTLLVAYIAYRIYKTLKPI